MGSKGTKIGSVLMCVLMLGLVLEQIQVEAKSCCRNTWARNCYNVCRLPGTFSQEICAKKCDCKIVPNISSRDECPSGYHSLTVVPNFEESDRTEYCILGCRSFVCDNMNNVDDTKEAKIIVERCGIACDRFCNRDAGIASVAA